MISFFDLADINGTDNYGNTALIYSVSKTTKAPIAKYLIELGANINHKNDGGMTALSIAKKLGNQEIIQLLLDAGAMED